MTGGTPGIRALVRDLLDSEVPKPTADRAAARAGPTPKGNEERAMRQSSLSERGFTLVELLIVMSIVSLSLLIANSSYTTFREAATLNRAARIVAADAALARSYAIRNRTTVSLVADEANQSYEVHDESGTVYLVRQFDAASEMKLETLDVKLPGDSLTFNSRGLMASGSATVDVGRNGGTRRVTLNAIARWQIEQL